MSYYKQMLSEYMKKNPWLREETTFDVQFTLKDYIAYKAKRRKIEITNHPSNE